MKIYEYDNVVVNNGRVSYALIGDGVSLKRVFPYRYIGNNTYTNISNMCSVSAIRSGVKRGSVIFKYFPSFIFPPKLI